ncbi:SDR family oxidoreductase [Aquihabitans sp. G128]|uniref:SDR family NAD(P)-dependent oxidoreductase n=1 Tax=Aquihabitans sp. G128 TaxID=2849779 RepID=UPI001C2242C0|nr:SDR family oxidoreductase [Aquihabitans sp. G128]QXC60111.1 SDR family oxidoreductase [Aquihabitans sp. G128]
MADGTRFEGRTAIVTGAASGIGRATAQRLAADGALVGCLDQAAAVEETVALIREAGGTATAASVDVRDEGSVAAAVESVAGELGTPTILANVAGVLRFAHTHEMEVAEWDLLIDVNLKGPFLMARAVIPHMLDSGGGVITNVASSAGMFGQAFMAHYCASKGGVVLMTKSLAWEYLKRNIRVNAISPSGVSTPMTGHVDFPDGMDFSLIAKTMAVDNKMLAPQDPASLIAFLSSDEASGINGAVIPIDNAVTA